MHATRESKSTRTHSEKCALQCRGQEAKTQIQSMRAVALRLYYSCIRPEASVVKYYVKKRQEEYVGRVL